MKIYAISASILLIIVAITALKWKISALAITWFCVDELREPNDEEIADYTRKVIGKMIKGF